MTGVLGDQISDFENTLSFPSEETSLGRGGFPHISLGEMYHARTALLTVFSTTQLGHSISLLSIHDYMDLEMSPDNS